MRSPLRRVLMATLLSITLTACASHLPEVPIPPATPPAESTIIPEPIEATPEPDPSGPALSQDPPDKVAPDTNAENPPATVPPE